MSVEEAYQTLYSAALIVIALLLAVMLIRSARGPGATDRLLSINMMGTLVNAAIIILSALLKEDWLVDVALIYTMISLGSTLILARVYVPDRPVRKPFRAKSREKEQ